MSTPMTVEGERALREELARLKKGRPAIAKAIGEARKLGDLKENADYHAAKDQQGMAEARIRYIESKLIDARIIDITRVNANGRVVFGSTVSLKDLDSDEEVKYRIVGMDEANVKVGKLSNASPLAREMIGKTLHDCFSVGEGPTKKEYSIEKIEYV